MKICILEDVLKHIHQSFAWIEMALHTAVRNEYEIDSLYKYNALPNRIEIQFLFNYVHPCPICIRCDSH